MSDDPQTVSPAEAAMRAAWQEVCMVEYRITGDTQKATAFADRIEKVYRDSVRAGVLREVADLIDREFPDPNPLASVFEPYVVDRITDRLRGMADCTD